MLAAELLLQLADQASLDLLEALVQSEGHEDHDGLLLVGQLDFLRGGDVQILQIRAVSDKRTTGA